MSSIPMNLRMARSSPPAQCFAADRRRTLVDAHSERSLVRVETPPGLAAEVAAGDEPVDESWHSEALAERVGQPVGGEPRGVQAAEVGGLKRAHAVVEGEPA